MELLYSLSRSNEPEAITSNLLSIDKNFSAVLAFGQSCISSKNIIVSLGTRLTLGIFTVICFIIVSTSKSPSNISL